MSILITGGAGYIGSHTVSWLRENGADCVVVDNLSRGHRTAAGDCAFYPTDLRDTESLRKIFRKHEIEAVIHFAADSQVGESMTDPVKYYQNNLGGGASLLQCMREANVLRIVFSSTAATYGEPTQVPIQETDPTVPTNPYGETKLAFEKCLRWCGEAFGLRSVALRYFNAAGAHKNGEIGEDHTPETHLIPLVLAVALGQRENISVFGSDYPTPDGTCIRDYIHVTDLAQAHAQALQYLRNHGTSMACNLGNGKGFSVQEVIDKTEVITDTAIARKITARRSGDPAALVASSEKARSMLGWKPAFADIDSIIASAWKWHSRHPKGYGDPPK